MQVQREKLRKVEATSKAHDVTTVDCPTTVGLGGS